MKYRKTIEESLSSDNNYCLRCWNEFTHLTPEDYENLDKLKTRLKRNNPVLSTALSKMLSTKEEMARPKWGKQVKCIDTGEVFDSLKDCCEKLSVNYCSLSRHCSNGIPTRVRGMRFEYID
jgi:hypothetical protein